MTTEENEDFDDLVSDMMKEDDKNDEEIIVDENKTEDSEDVEEDEEFHEPEEYVPNYIPRYQIRKNDPHTKRKLSNNEDENDSNNGEETNDNDVVNGDEIQKDFTDEKLFENKNDENDKEKENENEEIVEKDEKKALELKKKGNEDYKNDLYREAIDYYIKGIEYCPEENKELLSVLYGNIGQCHIKLSEWKFCIDACTDSLHYNSNNIKSYYRRGQSYNEIKEYYNASTDYKKLVEIGPLHPYADESRKEIMRLEPLVKEELERKKNEVIGTLKTGANWLLNKIGMDVGDFQLNQNENGSYNIQYDPNKNPKRQRQQPQQRPTY